MRFMRYYKQSLSLGFVTHQFLITKIMAHFEKLRLQSFTTEDNRGYDLEYHSRSSNMALGWLRGPAV